MNKVELLWIAFVLVGIGADFYCHWTGRPTLTRTIVHFSPRELTIGMLVVLILHFWRFYRE